MKLPLSYRFFKALTFLTTVFCLVTGKRFVETDENYYTHEEEIKHQWFGYSVASLEANKIIDKS